MRAALLDGLFQDSAMQMVRLGQEGLATIVVNAPMGLGFAQVGGPLLVHPPLGILMG
jgi:hypothetical protein